MDSQALQELEAEIDKHFIDVYPNEGVVFIKDGKVLPQENIHDEPEHNFLVDGWHFITIQPDAIIHSHPSGKAEASAADFLLARNLDVPIGIYAMNSDGVTERKWI